MRLPATAHPKTLSRASGVLLVGDAVAAAGAGAGAVAVVGAGWAARDRSHEGSRAERETRCMVARRGEASRCLSIRRSGFSRGCKLRPCCCKEDNNSSSSAWLLENCRVENFPSAHEAGAVPNGMEEEFNGFSSAPGCQWHRMPKCHASRGPPAPVSPSNPCAIPTGQAGAGGESGCSAGPSDVGVDHANNRALRKSKDALARWLL